MDFNPISYNKLGRRNISPYDFLQWNPINYTILRQIKVHIKHGELRDDSVVEEEDLKETKNMSINKVFEICQSIYRAVKEHKRIIKELSLLYVLVSKFSSFLVFPVF